MKTNVVLFSALVMFFVGTASGQEEETPLKVSAEKQQEYKAERDYAPRSGRGGGSLELPFFDDFSRYSLPTENPDIPVDWQRWEDDHVFINSTFPIEPPTIGVATLDGLDRTGYPYDFTGDGSEHIPCDTLTSLPIDLSGMDQTDNVYLMFFYQAMGRGNDPDMQDSLYLEFKVGDGAWVEKWKIPGQGLSDFQQVFVEVWDADFGNFYFVDDFQFRFRALSEGTGNLDHWHLDYILLNDDIDPENTVLQELAIMEPLNTLLNSDLTAMPWTHFIENPASYMLAGDLNLLERNLNTSDYNFRSGYRVEYQDSDDDLVWDMPNDYVNTSGNNSSIINTAISINNDPNFFVFDDSVNDTCAVFDVKFYHEIVDGTLQNDTMMFKQRFNNYYAHDDGTAERAWFVNTAGSNVAVKYQSVIPDTLLGVLIHFTPFRDDNSNENFILRAWNDDGGVPGEQIQEMFGSHSPEYYTSGYNQWKYYAYDNPVPVDGVFYCGFVQSSDAHLNVGNDKNTDSNAFSLFFTEGPFSSWQNSEISGSVMIRPVLRAGKTSDIVAVEELEELPWQLYPNPARDEVYINYDCPEYDVRIMDMSGRVVLSASSLSFNARIDVSDLSQGTYLMECRDEQHPSSVKPFIKE